MISEKQKSHMAFFLLSGYISLIFWNSLLNFSEFFNTTAHELIFYLTFGNSFGGILSFILLGLIGKEWNKLKILVFNAVVQMIAFFSIFYYCVWNFNPNYGTLLLVVAVVVTGFSSSWFQSYSMGLASETGPNAIKYCNMGTGFSGLMTNVGAYVMAKLFPLTRKDSAFDLTQLHKQVFLYTPLFLIGFLLYFLTIWKYQKDIRRVTDLSHIEFEEMDNPQTADLAILRRSVDINLGILVLYITTINLVAFFIFISFRKFDQGSAIELPVYYFVYNLADTLSKSIPIQALPKSVSLAHVENFLKIFINVYFFYIILSAGTGSDFWSSSYIRMALIFLCGISNGYLTNAMMVLNSHRFAKPVDKGRASYYNVFFILLGIAISNFFSIFLQV